MVTAHPGYSGVIATHVLALVNQYGWDYFKQLAQNKLMLVQSAVDPSGVVASGERPVAVDGGEYTFYQIKKKGNPVEIVYPKEGVPLVVSPTAIMSFAPHPNAAKLFTDFTFSREIQQVMADSEGLYTGHPEVKYPTDKPKLTDLKLLTRRSRGAGEARRGDPPALRGVLRRVRVGAARGLDRSAVVWVGAALALVVLMALPLGWLVSLSVSGERGVTLAHYRAVLGDPPCARPSGTRSCWRSGWGWARSPSARRWPGSPRAPTCRARRLIRTLVLASFVTPPFLGAFAWVMLAGPNAGLLNKLWRGVDRRRATRC